MPGISGINGQNNNSNLPFDNEAHVEETVARQLDFGNVVTKNEVPDKDVSDAPQVLEESEHPLAFLQDLV